MRWTCCSSTLPGNVRELENVIERAVVRSNGPRLDADSCRQRQSSKRFQMPQVIVPRGVSSGGDSPIEKRLIESTLEAAGGVQKRAAEAAAHQADDAERDDQAPRHPSAQAADLAGADPAADAETEPRDFVEGEHSTPRATLNRTVEGFQIDVATR